jgi:hypothetical protein
MGSQRSLGAPLLGHRHHRIFIYLILILYTRKLLALHVSKHGQPALPRYPSNRAQSGRY